MTKTSRQLNRPASRMPRLYSSREAMIMADMDEIYQLHRIAQHLGLKSVVPIKRGHNAWWTADQVEAMRIERARQKVRWAARLTGRKDIDIAPDPKD